MRSFDPSTVDQYAPTSYPDIVPGDAAARTAYARMLSMDATIYGFGSVYLYGLMYRQAIDPKSPDYIGFNRFAHDREMAKPGYKFRSPNVDTLYSNAWLDLTREPVLISTPAFGSRYYTLQFVDMYGNASNISLRTKGPGPGRYLIVTPEWEGDVPPGFTPFTVSTPYQWILMRVFPLDESDLCEVHRLQDAVTIEPLVSNPSAGQACGATAGNYPPAVLDDPVGFFKVLDFVIRATGHPIQEEALTYRYRVIGIGGSTPFDFDALDDATREGIKAGFADGMKVINTSRSQLGSPLDTHWVKTNSKGRYGFNYLARATLNYVGPGANVVEENQSFVTFKDDTGLPLDGSKGEYVFKMDSTPPVDSFWSLTLYDDSELGELYRNNLNRYAISNTTPGLKYGPDGSLTIYIQHRPPSDTANWLPAPNGPFFLGLRAYMPRAELLEGKWLPRGVRRVANA